eukprot:1102524-Prymnesium_polylepis.2
MSPLLGLARLNSASTQHGAASRSAAGKSAAGLAPAMRSRSDSAETSAFASATSSRRCATILSSIDIGSL